MNSNDDETQVFIVRLWRERREIEGARPVLRGTVEHVASGEQRAVDDMSSLVAFLVPYLETTTEGIRMVESIENDSLVVH